MEQEEQDKIKRAARDRDFVNAPFENFFLGSLKLKADYGYTDTSGYTEHVGNATLVELDTDQSVWGVKFGYFNKKLLRDIYLFGSQNNIDYYRKSKNKAFRWAFLDAVKFNMYAGYGKTEIEGSGLNNITIDERSNYYVGISYELPLSRLGNEFVE